MVKRYNVIGIDIDGDAETAELIIENPQGHVSYIKIQLVKEEEDVKVARPTTRKKKTASASFIREKE
jgi:ribulose bisphosphate carboxylase small subunit